MGQLASAEGEERPLLRAMTLDLHSVSNGPYRWSSEFAERKEGT
jgi:hypothetical protein